MAHGFADGSRKAGIWGSSPRLSRESPRMTHPSSLAAPAAASGGRLVHRCLAAALILLIAAACSTPPPPAPSVPGPATATLASASAGAGAAVPSASSSATPIDAGASDAAPKELAPRTGAAGNTRGFIACGKLRCDAAKEVCAIVDGPAWACLPQNQREKASAFYECDDGTDCREIRLAHWEVRSACCALRSA